MSRSLDRLLRLLLPAPFRHRFGNELMREWRRLRTDARQQGGRVAEWRYVAREARAFVGLVRDLRRQQRVPHSGPWGLWPDLLGAWRLATRRPMSTLATLGTLTLALASATAAFGVARAVLWRTLPFVDESRLVLAWEDVSSDGSPVAARVTSGRFVDWKERSSSLVSLAAFGSASYQVVERDGQTATVGGVRVSEGYFQILGVAPALGRIFDTGDHVPGARPVVLLSHEYWQRHFAGQSEVVGQSLTTTGTTYTIIGVLPEIWLPAWPVNPARVTLNPESRQLFSPLPPDATLAQNSRSHVYGVIGRIANRATVDAAERTLSAQEENHPDSHRATLRPLRSEVTGASRSPLMLLLGTALCVWLVACFNLAAIQLASFETRRSEFVVRSALGAGSWRLFRQLSAESALVTVSALGASLALTRVVLLSLPARLPLHVPFVTAPSLDGTSLLFSGTLAAVAAVIMVMWPARRLRSLKGLESQRSVSPGAAVFRGMVTVQLTGTVALVVIAVLLLSSMHTLALRDLGFDTGGVSVVDVSLPTTRYDTPEKVVLFEQQVRARLIDGGKVRDVAFAYDHPLEANWLDGVAILGVVPGADDVPAQAQLRIVSPAYFSVMHVRLVEGRLFEDSEGLQGTGVALVNQAFANQTSVAPGGRIRQMAARRTWGDVSPDEFLVVGVVEDERFRGAEIEPEPALYLSTRQMPLTAPSILVSAGRGPDDIAGVIRSAIRDAETSASLGAVRALDDIAADQQVVRSVTTQVVGALAAMALILATIGLHGLLALIVSARRREVGIRLALGARRSYIAGRIIRDSLIPVGVGVLGGLTLAQLAGRGIRSLLVDISVLDPGIMFGVSTLMVAIGVLAAVVPARRASRMDPALTLRGDM